MIDDSERRGAYRAELSMAGRLRSSAAGESPRMGRSGARARILNLSAGGALVQCDVHAEAGQRLRVEVPLDGELARAAGKDELHIEAEVIAASTSVPETAAGMVDTKHGGVFLRLRHLVPEGAAAYEAVRKAVFARQREELARRSGADEATPMATSPDERASKRASRSLKPGPRGLGRPGSNT